MAKWLSRAPGSLYTVRFHDGDERVLRRNAVTLMGAAPCAPRASHRAAADRTAAGPSHFQPSDTLGAFPLTDPDVLSATGEAPVGNKRRRQEGAEQRGSVEGAGPAEGAAADPDANRCAKPRHKMAARPTGRSHQVVLVNPSPTDVDGGSGTPWWPGVSVPAAEVTREMIGASATVPPGSLVVRFFEDKLYAIVEVVPPPSRAHVAALRASPAAPPPDGIHPADAARLEPVQGV